MPGYHHTRGSYQQGLEDGRHVRRLLLSCPSGQRTQVTSPCFGRGVSGLLEWSGFWNELARLTLHNRTEAHQFVDSRPRGSLEKSQVFGTDRQQATDVGSRYLVDDNYVGQAVHGVITVCNVARSANSTSRSLSRTSSMQRSTSRRRSATWSPRTRTTRRSRSRSAALLAPTGASRST